MSTFEKCQVVMLPTNEKADNIGLCNNILTYLPFHKNILVGKKEYPVTYQELYILSDEEIKELPK